MLALSKCYKIFYWNISRDYGLMEYNYFDTFCVFVLHFFQYSLKKIPCALHSFPRNMVRAILPMAENGDYREAEGLRKIWASGLCGKKV